MVAQPIKHAQPTPLLGKRKAPPAEAVPRSKSRKRRIMASHVRKLAVQSHDKALGTNGELNVSDFVRAREYEIQALENGIKASSGALTSRAFQEVPMDMRRRTASHNVKRVPKRLQVRARKEMRDDNTATRKRKRILPQQRLRIQTIVRMKALTQYRTEKQAEKKAARNKSANATKVLESFDGLADENVVITKDDGKLPAPTKIPLKKPRKKKSTLSSPPVPRAKFRKRQIDKTWLPTHVFHAKRAHLTSPSAPLWNFAIPLTPTEKSYRKTHRASTLRNAVAWDTSYMSTIGLAGPEKSLNGLLKALGVGSAEGDHSTWGLQGVRWRGGRRTWRGWLFAREKYPRHPICPVHIIWKSEEDVPSSSKDAMGTDENTKPSSLRKLLIRCHPSAFLELWLQVTQLAKVQKPSVIAEDLRYEIGSIELTGPSASEALLGILRPSQRTVDKGVVTSTLDKICELLRHVQNAGHLTKNVVLALDIKDPRLTVPPRETIRSQEQKKGIDKAILELCVRWPLDSEQMSAGLFDRANRARACKDMLTQHSVNKRKSKAIAGQQVEGGDTDGDIPLIIFSSQEGNSNQGTWTVLLPWKCVLAVWYSLMYYPISTGDTLRFGGIEELRQVAYEGGKPWFPADFPGTKAGQDWESRARNEAYKAWIKRPKGRRIEFDSIDLGLDRKGEIGVGWGCDWEALVGSAWPLYQIPFAISCKMLQSPTEMGQDAMVGLAVIKIIMINRGVPQTRARIYRLPANNERLKKQWLMLDRPMHSSNKAVTLPQPGDVEYPFVPDKEDLIGFITTGNFNLAAGKATGVGSIVLAKAIDLRSTQYSPTMIAKRYLCIVRNVGERFGRLARWQLVN